jgi:YHS domain-containing protein
MNSAAIFLIMLAQAGNVDPSRCAQAQPAIESILKNASARLEAARLANSAVEMRAAIDHLQGAMRDLQLQLAPCSALQAAADPHAGHATPATTAPSLPAPAPTRKPAADPHAGHTMPSTIPAPKRTPPPAPKPAADPPAGHTMPAPPAAEKVLDPVNGLAVDPVTAPKTTYQGNTYYFSSAESMKQFLQNPAKYAKKTKR